MTKAAAHGLVLYPDRRAQIREGDNIYDRLYDSRDGIAIDYRYGPRDLKELCADKLKGNIAIHRSAYRKLKEFSESYAPLGLPAVFDVVDIDKDKPAQLALIHSVATNVEAWSECERQAKQVISARKMLYRVFVELPMAVVIVSVMFWKNPPESVADLHNGCQIKLVQITQLGAKNGSADTYYTDGLLDNPLVMYEQNRDDLSELLNNSSVAKPNFCQITDDTPLKLTGDAARHLTSVYFHNIITFIVEVHPWIGVLTLGTLMYLRRLHKAYVARLEKIRRTMMDLL
ncbi:MAG: hypothetical protein ACU836_19040 [Gammaproteobacteria bacterium]